MSLAGYIEKKHKEDAHSIPGTKIALKSGELNGASLRYSQLFSLVRDLSKNFARGEVVAVSLDNTIEHAVLFLAIGEAGAVIAPLNPGYTETEFHFFLSRLSASRMIVGRNDITPSSCAIKAANRLGISVQNTWLTATEPPEIHLSVNSQKNSTTGAETPPSETCLMLFTSGTTGEPKLVPLSHSNLIASVKNISSTYNLSPQDSTLCIMPLFHVHGLMASLLSTLATGGTVVLPSTGKFSANTFASELTGNYCTWFSAVPTMLQIIINVVPDKINHNLRFVRSCSAALPPVLLEKVEKVFSVIVLEAYAMTEASHQMTSNPLGNDRNPKLGRRRPGTVGVTHGEVEIRIYTSAGNVVPAGIKGEVCVKGPSVIKGYFNNPSANANSFIHGFFRTGDEGYLSNDGFLTITGRLKELINKGGEKVSPIEIDSALLTHPAVAEAVSFAVPDLKYGEVVAVAIVFKSGKTATESDLTQHIGTKLASFKLPSKIFFATSLPKTATGKIQRRLVAEHFSKKSKL